MNAAPETCTSEFFVEWAVNFIEKHGIPPGPGQKAVERRKPDGNIQRMRNVDHWIVIENCCQNGHRTCQSSRNKDNEYITIQFDEKKKLVKIEHNKKEGYRTYKPNDEIPQELQGVFGEICKEFENAYNKMPIREKLNSEANANPAITWISTEAFTPEERIVSEFVCLARQFGKECCLPSLSTTYTPATYTYLAPKPEYTPATVCARFNSYANMLTIMGGIAPGDGVIYHSVLTKDKFLIKDAPKGWISMMESVLPEMRQKALEQKPTMAKTI
jgi:hypothetical protein